MVFFSANLGKLRGVPMFCNGIVTVMLLFSLTFVSRTEARQCVAKFTIVNPDEGTLLVWYRPSGTKQWHFVDRAERNEKVSLKIHGHGEYDILIRQPGDKILSLPNIDVCAVVEAKIDGTTRHLGAKQGTVVNKNGEEHVIYQDPCGDAGVDTGDKLTSVAELNATFIAGIACLTLAELEFNCLHGESVAFPGQSTPPKKPPKDGPTR
jgi:hypothetical protein